MTNFTCLDSLRVTHSCLHTTLTNLSPAEISDFIQDLVEILSRKGIWRVPKKVDQAAFARNEDGSFSGFEDDPPFVYHDGYLSSHYATVNYQEIDLTELQQEAVW